MPGPIHPIRNECCPLPICLPAALAAIAPGLVLAALQASMLAGAVALAAGRISAARSVASK